MRSKNIGWVLVLTVGSWVAAPSVDAQSIRSAGDGTETRVRVEGDRYRITGGQTSGDGANLFHSFEEFGLTADEIAVFRSGADIENILGRITGGDASYINGLIRVLGGDSNLFLMNPAGIVFGENVRLDLGGSFTATTATGIGFENGWFNVVGTPNYEDLIGTPDRYSFAVEQPGAIANYGTLSVTAGDVTLLAGTLVNTGSITAPNGDLTLATVPGSSRVRLTQEGSLLSLEFDPSTMRQLVEDPLALPDLLTGGTIAPPERFTVEDNQVQISNSVFVEAGDVAIAAAPSIQAQNSRFTATENLTVLDTTLQASEDLSLLAGDTVMLWDSEAAPLRAIAGDQLRIQGNETIDIFALTHPNSGLASGGDMVLRSPNPVLGDAYYFSGGSFRIEQTDGTLGRLISPFDPVIRSRGDISFASYEGASLHIIAGGQVQIPGSITITDFDGSDGLEERITLSDGRSILVDGVERPTLDIRAGVANVRATSIDGGPRPPGLNLNPGESPTSANITIGSVSIPETNGLIFLSTQYRPNNRLSGGTVEVQSPLGLNARGGDIIIDARRGVLLDGGLNTRDFFGESGNVLVLADSSILLTPTETGGIRTTGAEAGNVQLTSRNGTVRIGGGIRARGLTGEGGNVLLESDDRVLLNGVTETRASLSSDEDDEDVDDLNGGNVVVRSQSDTRTGVLITEALNGRGGSVVLTSEQGGVITRAINTRGRFGGEILINGAVGIDLRQDSITGNSENSLVAGNISLTSLGNIDAQSLRASAQGQGGTITLSGNDIVVNEILAQTSNSTGGTVNLTGANITVTGTMSVDGVVGGRLNMLATNTIQTTNLSAFGTDDAGGTVSLSAGGISVDSINADGGEIGLGGTVTLEGVAIETGDISVDGATGGTITVRSDSLIQSGNLSASGRFGNGGEVFLESASNITVFSIDARGGAASTGGSIEARANGLFQASDAVFDEFVNEPASITASSGLGGGSILIQHGGFSLDEPFVVGDAAINGTAAAITTGDDTLSPLQFLEGDFIQGNLEIRTLDVDNDLIIDDEFEDDYEEYDEDDLEEFEDIQVDAISLGTFGDEFYTELEGEFVGEFADYLDLTDSAVSSVDDARETLANVAQATGIRPALLYINFVPTVFGAENEDGDQLELVLVTPGEEPIRKRVLGATRAEVIDVANQFRQEVTNPIRTRTTSYLPYAQQLYDWMIAPLETELEAEGVENLSFVLGAGLRSLPIAALHDGEGFLVERYSVGLMPSLSLVDTRYRNIQDNQVLAMGAAEFTDQFPLPAVPFEIEAIANELWEGEAFLNQEFTLQTLLEQRQNTPFGIVHLATHGEFRSGELSNSYIQFWDQRLQLDQLRQLSLNDPPVNLLVLSACRMALGDAEAELGFAGLAVQAGVQTALASLWYVSDAGTLALMTEFYRALQENPTKAEALRSAQLAMIRGEVELAGDSLVSRGVPAIALPSDLLKGESPNLSHPYYWSSFTLIGSPW